MEDENMQLGDSQSQLPTEGSNNQLKESNQAEKLPMSPQQLETKDGEKGGSSKNNAAKNGSSQKGQKKGQKKSEGDLPKVEQSEPKGEEDTNLEGSAKENDVKKLTQLIDRITVQSGSQQQSAVSQSQRHKFWETQPVAQFSERILNTFRRSLSKESGNAIAPKEVDPHEDLKTELGNINAQQLQVLEDGPIDKSQRVEDVQKESMFLPEFYYWSECDLDDSKVVEEVYKLLSDNYVEDDDAMFRFNYSNDMLQWALRPPGYRKEWHVGVRQSSNNKLVGFIAAIPSVIRIKDQENKMVQIDFLCVHKKLRSKRLAPLLIKEITRRVHLQDIWYAAYTAGVTIPKPISITRYWHRLLNPKKLIEVGFSKLQPRMTMERTVKLYRVPKQSQIPGVREMKVPDDVEQVTQILNKYLERYLIAPIFNNEEVAHQFLHRPGIIETFVIEDPKSKKLTDFVSYYNIPSSVLGNPKHTELKCAYMYYTAALKHSAQDLVQEALILAKQRDYDVFSMLDVLENQTFIKDLKFAKGDGQLNYYLYNWRLTQELQPEKVGLILV